MNTLCNSSPKHFSSKFSIDNLLRSDEKENSQLLESCNDSKLDYNFIERWRRENFIKKRNLTEFFSTNNKAVTSSLDYQKKEEARYWIERSNFTKTKSVSFLNSTFSNSPVAYSSDVELIPSPSPNLSTWSPNDVFNRTTMETWFLNKVTQSPNLYSQRRTSDFQRTTPYRSWSSLLSNEENDFSEDLLQYHGKSNFDDVNEDSNRKKGQIRFTHSQSSELEGVFNIQKYISPQERKQLARTLDLSERQVKTWFQNRRAKWRRIKLEDEMRSRLAEKCLTRLTDNNINDAFTR